jgi:hypothetical protein
VHLGAAALKELAGARREESVPREHSVARRDASAATAAAAAVANLRRWWQIVGRRRNREEADAVARVARRLDDADKRLSDDDGVARTHAPCHRQTVAVRAADDFRLRVERVHTLVAAGVVEICRYIAHNDSK